MAHLLDLTVNAEIDLLDENDVYCPAIIISQSSSSSSSSRKNSKNSKTSTSSSSTKKNSASSSSSPTIEINYIGWGDDWNEELLLEDNLHRISQPAGKYVKKCKGWVKYHKDVCHWPSMIYIRYPKEGSKLGINYLKEEHKVYVKPFGYELIKTMKHLRMYAGGAWINTSFIWPYQFNIAKRWKENGLDEKFRLMFEAALKECEASPISDSFFKFQGSYDITQHHVKRNNKKHIDPILSIQKTSPEILHEVRGKVFQVVAPELVPILQNINPLPTYEIIQQIQDGIINIPIKESNTRKVIELYDEERGVATVAAAAPMTTTNPSEPEEEFRIKNYFHLNFLEKWKEQYLLHHERRGHDESESRNSCDGGGVAAVEEKEGVERGRVISRKRKLSNPQKIKIKRIS